MASSLFKSPDWSRQCRDRKSSGLGDQVEPLQMPDTRPTNSPCASSNPSISALSYRSSRSRVSSPNRTSSHSFLTFSRPESEYLDYPTITSRELWPDLNYDSELRLVRSHSDPTPDTARKQSRLLERLLPRPKAKSGPPHPQRDRSMSSDELLPKDTQRPRIGPLERVRHHLSECRSSAKQSLDHERGAAQRIANRQGKAVGLPSYQLDETYSNNRGAERRFFTFFDGVMALRNSGRMNSRGITDGRFIPAFSWIARSPLLELFTKLRQEQLGPIDLAYFYEKGFLQECERYFKKRVPPSDMEDISEDLKLIHEFIKGSVRDKDEEAKHHFESLESVATPNLSGTNRDSACSRPDGVSLTSVERDHPHLLGRILPEVPQIARNSSHSDGPLGEDISDLTELMLPVSMIDSLPSEQLNGQQKQRCDEEIVEKPNIVQESFCDRDDEVVQSWKQRVDSLFPSALFQKAKRPSTRPRASIAKGNQKSILRYRGDSKTEIKQSKASMSEDFKDEAALSHMLMGSGNSDLTFSAKLLEDRVPAIPHLGEPGPSDWDLLTAKAWCYERRNMWSHLHRTKDKLCDDFDKALVNRAIDSNEYRQAFVLMNSYEHYEPFLRAMVVQTEQEEILKEIQTTKLIKGGKTCQPRKGKGRRISAETEETSGPTALNARLLISQGSRKLNQKSGFWKSLLKRKSKHVPDESPASFKDASIIKDTMKQTNNNQSDTSRPVYRLEYSPTSLAAISTHELLPMRSQSPKQPHLWVPSPCDSDDEAKLEGWRRTSDILGREIGTEEAEGLESGVSFITAGIDIR